MAQRKKYYWLKLPEDFFQQRPMKKLRKMAGGDTYTIIYLKMQLLSLKKEGLIVFEGIEENVAAELALELDETAEDVQMTLLFLQQHGLIVEVSEDEYLLPKAVECMGSEVDSARRVREYRERQKMIQSNADSLHCNSSVTTCNTEKEREKEIEIEKSKNKDKEGENGPIKPAPRSTAFKKPTIDEITAYCNQQGYVISPEGFFNYYESNGWMVGKNKMKDWKAAVRSWNSREVKEKGVPTIPDITPEQADKLRGL